MASITLDEVRKRYPRGPEVVKGISLTIADGELVTLVGPSGCGKSTLLNLVAGLERPTQGSIRFDDQVVDALDPGERDVAMVFQSYALYPHLSVRRNLAFPLEVRKLDRRTIDARVLETARRLDIEPLLDRKPRELSGGQRQRVALGRALVRARVYLFDEPLSNLDAALRTQMRAEIKKLHEALRATFLYVTHDQAEAMTLSDRVVVLHEGVVQQIAPPREIYDRPSNTFVASFIGSPQINFLPPVGALAAHAPPGREVLVGVRPEHVLIDTGPRPADALAGHVYLVEPLGAETWVTLDLDHGHARLTGRAAPDFSAPSGSPAWARPSPTHLHLFDPQTHTRIQGTGH